MGFAECLVFLVLLLLRCLQSLKGLRVVVDLSLDGVIVLRGLSVQQSDLAEDFTDLPQTVDLAYVVSLAFKEVDRYLLNLGLFLLAVARVSNTASVCKSIVHCEFLL